MSPQIIPHTVLSFFFRRRLEKKRQMISLFATTLGERFTYFRELPDSGKLEFLDRVYRFHKSKNFNFVGHESNVQMEALISAAAVQLTFGLPEYRFNFFNDIYIMKDAYTYGLSSEAWAGHVNRKGIYISWNHFEQGFANSHDRCNTGLHEMAHALEYEFAYGDYLNNKLLKSRFEEIMRIISEILIHEQADRSPIYTDQGIQNKHECWAESVEVFFENPADLLKQYPGLYESIKMALHQDPLIRSSNA